MNFTFDTFDKGCPWVGRTDVVASLVRDGVDFQQHDRDISRYESFIVASANMHALEIVDGAYNAGITIFQNVDGDVTISGVLIHSNGVPIACISDARGLPTKTNGGEIWLMWDAGPNKIFRL